AKFGVVKIKNIQSKTIDLNNIQFIEEESVNDRAWNFKLTTGDLLIAMTGAQVGKIGIMPKTNDTYLLNQRVGKFYPKEKNQLANQFIYQIVQSSEFQKSVDNIAQGAAQPNISGAGIGQIEIILPPISIIENFEHICQPLMDEIFLLDYKNQNLRQTRDLLLPKLISGKVDVSELNIDIGET
ncbi:MAG: putative restriction endonuclease, partial [Candidatus Scalindua rubra]